MQYQHSSQCDPLSRRCHSSLIHSHSSSCCNSKHQILLWPPICNCKSKYHDPHSSSSCDSLNPWSMLSSFLILAWIFLFHKHKFKFHDPCSMLTQIFLNCSNSNGFDNYCDMNWFVSYNGIDSTMIAWIDSGNYDLRSNCYGNYNGLIVSTISAFFELVRQLRRLNWYDFRWIEWLIQSNYKFR